MKPHRTCLLCLLLIAWPTQSQAQETTTPTDAIMQQIYSASSGRFRGEAHFRQDGETPGWVTSDHEVTCSQHADDAGGCEGVTGGDEWRVSYRYSDGIEYIEGEAGDQRWTMQYRIVDLRFSNPEDFSYKREWTNVSGGVEYHGIDEVVQMGSRSLIVRRMKQAGAAEDYSYVLFEYLDRVE